MRVHAAIFRSAVIASTLLLNSCSHGVFSTPLYLATTISPRPASIPAGGTIVFNATASNNLGTPQWSLLAAADTTSAGTLTAINGSTNSILYTAPAAPPIYTADAGVGFTQGTVTVEASVAPPAQSTLPVAHDAVTFFIIVPTIAVGLSPATVAVSLGGSQYFAGYAVGSVNNALTWEVNGVVGGSVATGTITAAGVYTAPLTLPMTGNTVTITIVSQADPTRTASAVITLS